MALELKFSTSTNAKIENLIDNKNKKTFIYSKF